MNTKIRRGARLRLAALLVTSLVVLAAGPGFAQERLHQITWAHQDPATVSHFIVLVSPTESVTEATREVNVGRPQGTLAGHFTLFSAMVEFEPTEYLAVRAVGHDGLASAPSSWGAMPPSRPGQPLLAED